jgi:hypothetical protein
MGLQHFNDLRPSIRFDGRGQVIARPVDVEAVGAPKPRRGLAIP